MTDSGVQTTRRTSEDGSVGGVRMGLKGKPMLEYVNAGLDKVGGEKMQRVFRMRSAYISSYSGTEGPGGKTKRLDSFRRNLQKVR